MEIYHLQFLPPSMWSVAPPPFLSIQHLYYWSYLDIRCKTIQKGMYIKDNMEMWNGAQHKIQQAEVMPFGLKNALSQFNCYASTSILCWWRWSSNQSISRRWKASLWREITLWSHMVGHLWLCWLPGGRIFFFFFPLLP